MFRRTLLTTLFSLLIAGSVIGQGTVPKRKVRNYSLGVNINSYSSLLGGFIFQHQRGPRDDFRSIYETSIHSFLHPKEVELMSINEKSFKYNKINYAYYLRLGTGTERTLFEPSGPKGLSLSANLIGGLSMSLTKPYYIYYKQGDQPSQLVQYDPEIHNKRLSILGSGPFSAGINKTRLNPGVYAKLGLRFRMHIVRKNLLDFELSASADRFSEEVVILYGAKRYKYITSLHANLMYVFGQ